MIAEGDFRRGYPPHVGWWLTQAYYLQRRDVSQDGWRYWDGDGWSIYHLPHTDHLQPYTRTCCSVDWCMHWPEGAEVGRFNPDTGECTGAGPCPYLKAGITPPWKARSQVNERALVLITALLLEMGAA